MRFIDVSAPTLFPGGAGRAPLQLADNVVGRPRRSVQASSRWSPVGATIKTKAVWTRHPQCSYLMLETHANRPVVCPTFPYEKRVRGSLQVYNCTRLRQPAHLLPGVGCRQLLRSPESYSEINNKAGEQIAVACEACRQRKSKVSVSPPMQCAFLCATSADVFPLHQ